MRARALFVLYAAVVTLLPVAALPLVHGADAAFLLLTGDAYLYLGIALASTPDIFSFDGELATNGFHPLWQVWVWVLAQGLGDAPLALMNAVAWSAVACVLAGVLLLGAAIHRATGSWLLACASTPGIYFLAAGQGLGNLAVWDFFSGMEAGLALALTGWVAWIVAGAGAQTPRAGTWLTLGAVLALLMLTRLDEAFVPGCMAIAWVLWSPRGRAGRLPAAVMIAGPSAIALAAYLAYNQAHSGMLMPVSAMAKGEGALLSNIYVTLATFFSPLVDLREALTGHDGDRNALVRAAFRPTELAIPALMAAGFIVILLRRFRDAPWAPLAAGMCAAVVLKGAYNFAQVNYWHQASWYYAFACGTVSFTAALIFAPVAARLRARAPEAGALLVAVMVLTSLLQGSLAYVKRVDAPVLAERRAFLQAGPVIAAAIGAARPGAKLLEFGDGFINFTLPLPVRHGFVFAGDSDSLAALKGRRLLRVSYDAGYEVMASYEYMRWPGAALGRGSDEIRAHLAASFLNERIKAELADFEFEVIHVHAPLDIAFIAFAPR
jgi:hypothetical protein